MPDVERVPAFVGATTLVAGALLLARPATFTGPAGLDPATHDRAVRLIGLADLVLVPGLLSGAPRAWPWMVGRAALSVGQAAYADGVAAQASNRTVARGAAVTLAALAVADTVTALRLRAAGR